MSKEWTNLIIARKAKKWSQTKLAQIIDVDPTTVSAYEKGTRRPTIEVLIKLSNVLNVTIDFLLGEPINNMYIISKEEYDTLNRIREELNKTMECVNIRNSTVTIAQTTNTGSIVNGNGTTINNNFK